MPKRLPPWFVRRDPDVLEYAFFISHVAEDSAEVATLKAEIDAVSGRGGRQTLRSFFDLHTWPIGNVNSGVIRHYLLRSAFMVAWVTPAYLAASRGWAWMELAYAELIEVSINLGRLDMRHPYIVPVFRNVTVNDLERTPLLGYWQRQLIQPAQTPGAKEVARTLVDFYTRKCERPETTLISLARTSAAAA